MTPAVRMDLEPAGVAGVHGILEKVPATLLGHGEAETRNESMFFGMYFWVFSCIVGFWCWCLMFVSQSIDHSSRVYIGMGSPHLFAYLPRALAWHFYLLFSSAGWCSQLPTNWYFSVPDGLKRSEDSHSQIVQTIRNSEDLSGLGVGTGQVSGGEWIGGNHLARSITVVD